MHSLQGSSSTGIGRSSSSISQMAPADRKRRRRTQYKRRLFQPNKSKLEVYPQDMNPCTDTKASSPAPVSPLDIQDNNNCNSSNSNNSYSSGVVGCSTPKAQRFLIPEPLSCPPAPKKRRVTLHCSPDKPSIPFFNPPDLELFFLLAFRNIST